MQITIDTVLDTPKALRILAQFLDDYAAAHSTPGEPAVNESPPEHGLSMSASDFAPIPSVPVPVAPVIPLPVDLVPIVPPPPGPAGAPEFDSAGVAYDPNKHSSTRGKTIDGKWKLRRNRSGSVPAVTNGTLAIQGVPVPTGQETVAIATYVAGRVPVPLPPPVPASIVADDDAELEADEPAPPMDFPTFITRITAGMNAGTITQLQIAETLAHFRLDSLFSLNMKPELISDAAKAFGFV